MGGGLEEKWTIKRGSERPEGKVQKNYKLHYITRKRNFYLRGRVDGGEGSKSLFKGTVKEKWKGVKVET